MVGRLRVSTAQGGSPIVTVPGGYMLNGARLAYLVRPLSGSSSGSDPDPSAVASSLSTSPSPEGGGQQKLPIRWSLRGR